MIDFTHRINLLDTLSGSVQEKLDAFAEEDQSFVRVAAEWLGYDQLAEEEHFVDGAGDRGVDFWYASDTGFDVFQVKSHRLGPLGKVRTEHFDAEGVRDLQRILTFLTDENADALGFRKLQRFRDHWEHAISRLRMGEATPPLQLMLGLIVLGDGLTNPGQQEYDSFVASLSGFEAYREVPIEVRSKLYTVDDIMLARWRQDNREWRNRSGQKRSTIDLYPETDQWIHGRQSAVFHCRAIDVIMAFEGFGYQIFEPNVRAHISKSKVNMAIKESLMHRVSRKEFQFLNNGLTVICKSFSKPTENRPCFRIREPGVVNGLQTVVALHEAYHMLPLEDQKDIEEKCYVLVRLLRQTAVGDVNRVVLATNTQNPMQARNLRSNTTEQVYYERLMAEEGWFYERKQGAWDAFSSDPSRWRTLSSHRKRDFQAPSTGGRPRYRRVDNELAAQTWLAFIGFSSDAVHNKRYIFDEDDWYGLVFLQRTLRHAADYNYEFAASREEWTDQAPSHRMMLVSYLARQFAKTVALSGRENRELACRRLGLDASQLPREQLDLRLAEDEEYLVEQVLSGMSFVFVEFFGYMLYRALGDKLHDVGFHVLRNGCLRTLHETGDFDSVAENVRAGAFDPDDVIAIAWSAFRNTIDQLMAGTWKQSYQTARNRTRFNHSTDTRTRICKELDQLNSFMERKQLTRPWAAGIPPETGLYRYVHDILLSDLSP